MNGLLNKTPQEVKGTDMKAQRNERSEFKTLHVAVERDGEVVNVVEFADPRKNVCERISSIPGLSAYPIAAATLRASRNRRRA